MGTILDLIEAQNSRYHKAEMTTMKNRHDESMRKMENAAKMREMKLADAKDRRDAIQNALQEVCQAIEALQKDIKSNDLTLEKANAIIGGSDTKLEAIRKKIKEWPKTAENELKEVERKRNDAEKAYNDCKSEVDSAIAATGQIDDGVCKFLIQCQQLINATCNNKVATIELEGNIKSSSVLLVRLCDHRLSIEKYIDRHEPSLKPLLPILSKKNIKYCKDIRCRNDKEFNQFLENINTEYIKQQLEQKNDDIEGAELAKQLMEKWGLSKYCDKLIEEGWDDPIDWEDIEEADLKELEWKKPAIKKFKRRYKDWSSKSSSSSQGLNIQQTNGLRELCIDCSWKKDQNDKLNQSKKRLLLAAPVLTEFFVQIDDAVKMAQKILTYPQELDANSLNEVQLKAIERAKEENDEKKANDKDHDEDDENSQRDQWRQHSECQIFCELDQKWHDGTIIKITNDDEGEWLGVSYRIGDNQEPRYKQIQRFNNEIRPKLSNVAKQCKSLTVAAITSFNVVETLKKKYEDDQNVASNALDEVGKGIECGSIDLFKSLGQMRQSVILAQNLMSLKPAKMENEKRKKLWSSIDKGIIQIYQSALEIVKISVEYFNFFIRFKSSFSYFQSCYDGNKDKDISLFVSTEHLHQDIQDFVQFQQSYTTKLNDLDNVTMEVIGNCIEEIFGEKQFEQHQRKLKELEEEYIKAGSEYNEKRKELQDQYDKLRLSQSKIKGDVVKCKEQQERIPAMNEQNKKYLEQLQGQRIRLQKDMNKIKIDF